MSAPLVDYRERTTPWPGTFADLAVGDAADRRTARIHVRETPGPTTDGTFFHVHGLGGSASNWTDLATALSGRHRSLAIDLPGWGFSDPAPDGDYSIAAGARWVIAAIESLADGPVHLVGNSFGGLISIRVAATRPDLVRTLTLISPAVSGYETNGTDPRMALLAIPGVGQRLQRRINRVDPVVRARMTAEICFARPERIPPFRLQQQADELVVRSSYPWAVPAFDGTIKSIAGTFISRRKTNPWRLAASISAPTAIIWGDRDKLVSVRRAPKLAEVIADSRLHIFPDVGHTAQLEVPQLTAEAIVALVDSETADATGLAR